MWKPHTVQRNLQRKRDQSGEGKEAKPRPWRVWDLFSCSAKLPQVVSRKRAGPSFRCRATYYCLETDLRKPHRSRARGAGWGGCGVWAEGGS